MKLSILKGATSVLVRVFIADSSSTTGAGLTGLVYNSASLVCYRARDDDGNAGGTSITLATATKGTWTSGGFVEKDATNMPGWYEFGIPNAALASGSRSVSFMLKGATNMVQTPIEIELTGVDNQDATAFGVSRIDAAVTSRLAPTTAGRTLDVSTAGNAGIDWSNVEAPTSTVDLSATTIAITQKVDVETIKTQTITCAAAVTIYPAVGMTATANGNFEIVFATDFATNYDTTLDKWSVTGAGGASAADVWSYGTRELTGNGGLTFDANLIGILGTAIAGTAADVAGSFSTFFNVFSPVLTCASNNQTGDSFARIGANGGSLTDIPNMIFNTALPGAYSAGTCGYYIDAQISAAGGGGGASVADIFNEALPGAYTAGSAGYIIGTNLNATVSSRASATDLATVAGYIDTEIATLQTSVDDIPTVAEFNARTLPSADYFDPAADAVANVTLVNTLTTYTGNTPQTGDAYAIVNSGTHGNAAIKTVVDTLNTDIYTAYIEFVDDDVAATDEYSIRWRKNGVNVTSGITTPLIQVINFAGTDLIASTAMTQIGSTAAYKYTASTTERIAAGQNYEVKCTATIDGSARTFSKIISRDS